LSPPTVPTSQLLFTLATLFFLGLWGKALLWNRAVTHPQPWLRRGGMLALTTALAGYLLLAVYLFRPAWLPQEVVYDFTDNLPVTQRLVDPALLKVERWTIQGHERPVLFAHPSPAGSTSLVYPVRLPTRAHLRAALAVAPEAWSQEGDGVVFSVFVEDEAGMHLVYSRYVDPKHHAVDRRWIPVEVNLSAYGGKITRLILTTSNGPAGDGRYDWAGWSAPRLERTRWP
jgi:hypothetical protein